jgi:hypothetical protein
VDSQRRNPGIGQVTLIADADDDTIEKPPCSTVPILPVIAEGQQEARLCDQGTERGYRKPEDFPVLPAVAVQRRSQVRPRGPGRRGAMPGAGRPWFPVSRPR